MSIGTNDGNIIGTIIKFHMLVNDMVASGHVWPGIRIHVIEIVVQKIMRAYLEALM